MDAKADVVSLGSISPRSDVIRVTMPVNVANDLNLLAALLKDLGGRIGCKACISGAACFFDIEKNFVVNEKGLIQR